MGLEPTVDGLDLLRLGNNLGARLVNTRCEEINRSHTQQHDKNKTTNKEPHERTQPHTQQRAKVARRRCVPPPTPGWVAAPKSKRVCAMGGVKWEL